MSKAKSSVGSQTRPTVRARRWVISSGHYLASAAGGRIFEMGGNATDAGVAAGLALNVLLPEWTSLGGVAPVLVVAGSTGDVRSIAGLGRWPRAVDASIFRMQHGGRIPVGVLRSVTPGALAAWLTALKSFGRLRLQDVIAPALELAEFGTPVHSELRDMLARSRATLANWPGTVQAFLPGGRVPPVGSRVPQPDLARTLKRLAAAAEEYPDRQRGIDAAYELFYRGEIARQISDFFQREGGWIRYEDLAEYEVTVEEPQHIQYRGIDFYAGGPWCQGPVVLQTLKLCELDQLRSLGHNSAAYIHHIVEALKLGFADRDAYYGDPEFVDVPIHGLLSDDYARVQRARIDPLRCMTGVGAAGNPWEFEQEPRRPPPPPLTHRSLEPGTSNVCAADAEGNAFSSAPSDGILSGPVMPGLGFVCSGRGVQSWIDDGHPSSIEPGKRPFLTPNPGIAMRGGRFLLAYGTPGMDTQPQALVQLIANVVDFKMGLQQAVEAPRFVTRSFPKANDPHEVEPASLYLEGRIGDAVAKRLAGLGHDVRMWPGSTPEAGGICAVLADWETDTLIGAADPRRLCYAIGW